MKNEFQKARMEAGQNNVRHTGVILLQLMDQIWQEIAPTSGHPSKDILEQCPPSLKKDYGKDLQELIQKLENLSFSEKTSHNAEELILQCEALFPKILKYKAK